MKQIAKTALKGLFIVILFTAGTVALSTTGVKTVSEANAATINQVYQYLQENGYTVVSVAPSGVAKFDWVAHTILNGRHLITTVHCNSVCIVDHTDIAM